MELISEEMCDWNQLTGVTVTPLTFEIIILGKSRQRRGVEVKKTKQVESASHQSTNPQLYIDTTFQHVDLDSK